MFELSKILKLEANCDESSFSLSNQRDGDNEEEEEDDDDETVVLRRKRGLNLNNKCKFCSLHVGPTPEYHRHIFYEHRDRGIVCNLFLDGTIVCNSAFPNMIARNCHRKLFHPDSTKWMYNHAAEGVFRCKKQCRVRINAKEFENHTYQHHKNGNDDELFLHDQLLDRCKYRCPVHMGTYNSIYMHQSKRNHPVGDVSIKMFKNESVMEED